MKRAALLFLFMTPSLAGEPKPVIPPGAPNGSGIESCLQVRGLAPGSCLAMSSQEWANADLVKAEMRGLAAQVGFFAANAFYPPPLTSQQLRSREDGRKVMEASPQLNFPELDGFNRNAPGWCVCSSSVQKEAIDHSGYLSGWKPTGKGKCEDLMVCYVKGVPGK